MASSFARNRTVRTSRLVEFGSEAQISLDSIYTDRAAESPVVGQRAAFPVGRQTVRNPDHHFPQARFWPVTWSLPTDSCAESLADPFPAEIRSLRNNLAESSRRYRHMVVPLYKPGGSSPSKCGSYPLKRRHCRRSASRRTSLGTRLRSPSRQSRSSLTAPATLL